MRVAAEDGAGDPGRRRARAEGPHVLLALLIALAPIAPPAAAGSAAPLGGDRAATPSSAPPLRFAQQKPQPTPQKPQVPAADPALAAAAGKIAGPFSLSSAAGDRSCDMTLKVDRAGSSAFAVAFDKGACAPLAFTEQVAGWVPDPSGAIRLVNAQGRTVAEFTEATAGAYEALREGDGVYFLAPPGAKDTLAVNPQEMVGDWDVSRAAGTTVCRWLLTDKPTKGGFVLQVAPGCDASIVQFAPSAWAVEGGNIVVSSSAGAPPLRFARQEDGVWSRTPERGRPLLLSRP